MPLFKKPKSPYWWADISVDGKRHRVSTKQTTKIKAQHAEAQIIHDLSTGARMLRAKPPLLRQFAERFKQHIAASRLEPKTKLYYLNGWRMLADLDIAGMRLDAITTGAASVLKLPGSGSNANCALRTLRRMLSIAVEENVIQRAPRIRLAKEKRRELTISAETEGQILEAMPKTPHDAFLLVLDAGMRPGEVVALEWPRVDFDRGVILVAAGKTPRARRHLAMTTRVRAMLLERWAAKKKADEKGRGSVWVFPSSRTKSGHIRASSLSMFFGRTKRKLGLPADMVLYSARHTFATDIMEATGDISKVGKTLGHGSLGITSRYLHPEVAKVGEIMDARNDARRKKFGTLQGTPKKKY